MNPFSTKKRVYFSGISTMKKSDIIELMLLEDEKDKTKEDKSQEPKQKSSNELIEELKNGK